MCHKFPLKPVNNFPSSFPNKIKSERRQSIYWFPPHTHPSFGLALWNWIQNFLYRSEHLNNIIHTKCVVLLRFSFRNTSPELCEWEKEKHSRKVVKSINLLYKQIQIVFHFFYWESFILFTLCKSKSGIYELLFHCCVLWHEACQIYIRSVTSKQIIMGELS